MSDSTASPRKGFTRRTLVKGAAWSVPVVAVASSMPAYATSGGKPGISIGLACKQPGASCSEVIGSFGYTFAVTVTNTTDKDVYIYTGTTQPAPLYVPMFTISYTSVPDIEFFYRDARRVTFALDGTPLIGDYVSQVANQSLLIPAKVGSVPGSVTIIVDAGTNDSSPSLRLAGSLYFAWGHEPLAGDDLDHPYEPKPTSEGWTGGEFSFTDPNTKFTSCNDNFFYDCVPFPKP